MSSQFLKFAFLPPGLRTPNAAIAACRAGDIGLINAAFAPDDTVIEEISAVARLGKSSFGVALGELSERLFVCLQHHAAGNLDWIIVDESGARRDGERLQVLRTRGVQVLLVVLGAEWPNEVPVGLFDGLVLKGNEAGGFVGEDSSFVLTQKWSMNTELPFYVHGGMTPETAAACACAGAAGALFDSQLLLLQEVGLSHYHSSVIEKLAGNETLAVGDVEHGEYFRVLHRPQFSVSVAFAQKADGARLEELRAIVTQYAESGDLFREDGHGLLPLGQDVGVAKTFKARFETVSRLFEAVDEAIRKLPSLALESNALGEGSPLALDLGTPLPLVQGPMTRVSDTPAFAEAVAEGGGLPMLAFALLRGDRLEEILRDTQARLGERPWGIGLLGFAPQQLLDEQLELALQFAPKYAIVAGGRPDQVVKLEQAGIKSFLHVPSAALVPLFLGEGARRFIFEGRECGGHVGPLSSFVLWSSMIERLNAELDRLGTSVEASEIQVLFAGGIHDALGSAMVQVLAAPLSKRGVRVGILMGSAYLFTREIVETGAVVPQFQQEVLTCKRTVNLESGPGHASRCAYTPFAAEFFKLKRTLREEKKPADESRQALDDLILGRLRIASKGQTRSDDGRRIEAVELPRQREEGMYMLGQVATMRSDLTTIAELHGDVSAGAKLQLERAAAKVSSELGATENVQLPLDIAIVGMASLLPGAESTSEFWENILDKVDAITEIPRHRWDYRLYYDADRKAPDKVYSKWGGFMNDLVFDPTQYGMPPRSLDSIDPMQLIALEVASRTLKDAGYGERPFARERASVIIGVSGGTGDVGTQYGLRAELPRFSGTLARELGERLPEWTEDSFPGILNNVTAGRVANRLDFGGANFTTDAACASSLAAIYQGISELSAGRSDFVLAGGVDTVQGPFGYLCFSKTQALSPRGRCSSFDSTADGIVISEGVAMFAMKRLADAERDGDRIYGVIKGIGTSSDGRARGLTAPLPAGQLRAMRRAYAQAGYGPDTVGLFEAHGTGTVAGDTAELESTIELVRECGSRPHQAVVGSVKTMIGHTKATAGSAGLLKAALALHHQVLPPHRGVSHPNPVLNQEDCPLYLAEDSMPWLRSPTPRRASVSAFGFGGTNFHVTLEEYRDEFREWLKPTSRVRLPAELCLFVGANREELAATIREFLDRLGDRTDVPLRQIAAHLAHRYREHQATLAVVASSCAELAEKLRASQLGPSVDGAASTLPDGVFFRAQARAPCGKVAFLFSGQGSQYPGMLRELSVDFPSCTATLAEANGCLREAFEERFGARSTLSSFIHPRASYAREPGTDAATLQQTDVAQPALGAVDTALYRLISDLGIKADMMAGHSFGEFVALHAAGVYDFPTLLRLSAARGRFIVDEAKNHKQELGGMVAVAAPREQVEQLLSGISDLVLANHNAPRQCIVSGTQAGLNALVTRLKNSEHNPTHLPVAAAFHSPLVEPAQAKLAEEIGVSAWSSPKVPVYSNASGLLHEESPLALQSAMAEHLTRPVEFVREIEKMYADGARIFIEVGPKSVLSRLTSKILAGKEHQAVPLDAGNGTVGFLRALAQLLVSGVSFDPKGLFYKRVVDPKNDPLSAPVAEPPAHAFRVNGSGVRPVASPQRQVGITLEAAQAIAAAVRPAASASEPPRLEPSAAEGAPVTALPSRGTRALAATRAPTTTASSVPGRTHRPTIGERRTRAMDEPDAALSAYFETMRQFLETQERVMSAYLGQPAAPRVRRTVGGAPTPARIAPAARNQLRNPEPESGVAPTTAALGSEATGTTSGGPAPSQSFAVAAAPAKPEVAPEPPTPTVPQPGTATGVGSAELTRDELAALLLGVVEEKTGYPKDMVGLSQNLEGDLGIDSIKRIEVVGALLQLLPEQRRQALMDSRTLLNTQQTLDGMLDILAKAEQGQESSASSEGPRPFDSAGAGNDVSEERLPRYILASQVAPAPAGAPRYLTEGRVLIVPDELGFAEHLVSILEGQGTTCALMPTSALLDEEALLQWLDTNTATTDPWGGVVHCAALGRPLLNPKATPSEVREALFLAEKSLFLVLRALDSKLHSQAHVVALTSLGGHFARSNSAFEGLGLQGGAVGLLKSYGEEQPHLRVKAIDLDPRQAATTWGGLVADEMSLALGRQEIGFPGGIRTSFHTKEADLPSPTLTPASLGPLVVLATGGARGVTAEVLRELALPGNTLVLTGRRPLPQPETDDISAYGTAHDLRNHFITLVREKKVALTPGQINQRVQQILSHRETLANVADFRSRGAVVEYHAVDVTHEDQLSAFLDDVAARIGPIGGVVHGAGVIEDKLVADKSSDSWSRVVETKVLGLYLLQKHIPSDPLKFFTVFSSVAGRYGNSGQADYATANELMNRLCAQLKCRYGAGTHVGAYCWGPWGPTTFGAGMVTKETEAKFAEKGVALVTAAQGRHLFSQEICVPEQEGVEFIFGKGPWEERERILGDQLRLPEAAPSSSEHPLLSQSTCSSDPKGGQSISFTIDLTHAYLSDHCIDGSPVVPAAVAVELFAEASRNFWPGWLVTEIQDLRLLKGIELKQTSRRLVIDFAPPPYGSSEGFEVSAVLRSEVARGAVPLIHYKTKLRLTQLLPAAPPMPTEIVSSVRLAASDAYHRYLFHGPLFQGLQGTVSLSEQGAFSPVRASSPKDWLPRAISHGKWQFDPGLLDLAPQMAIIWARTFRNSTSLPTRFGRITRYQEHLPEVMRMIFICAPSSDPSKISAQIYFVDDQGRVLIQIDDLECIASEGLNRLAEDASRRPPDAWGGPA